MKFAGELVNMEMGPVALQASYAALVTSATSCDPLANLKTRKSFKK